MPVGYGSYPGLVWLVCRSDAALLTPTEIRWPWPSFIAGINRELAPWMPARAPAMLQDQDFESRTGTGSGTMWLQQDVGC